MARAQVNTTLSGGERPTPMASPMGISAPVAAVQENGMLALARSLSAVRPELNQYLEESKQDYQEAEANRAYDTIQGMTHEQAKAAVDAGTMRETESPWFRAAFQKQFGLAHAAKRKREIITEYNNSFDKQNGDIDSFLAQFAQADYEQYGNSEFISAGIREGMSGVFSSVKDQQAEFRNTQLQTMASEQFYSVARDTIDTTMEAGGDVNAAISAVVQQHSKAGLIDQDKADAALLGLADEYASSGNVAGLDALLSADPFGRGSFKERGGFAVKSQALVEQAKATAADTARKSNIVPRADLDNKADNGMLDERDLAQAQTLVDSGQASPEWMISLINQNRSGNSKRLKVAVEANARTTLLDSASKLILTGQGAAVQDTTIALPDGTSKNITGKELREAVVNEQMTALLSSEGGSPAVAAQHLANWSLSENYQPWEDTLSNGYLSLTGALTKPDKDGKTTVPTTAQQAYGLWKELSGTEAVRERHVKDSTAASVYRDAEVLEQIMGMAPEEALTASASIDRKTSRVGLATSIDRKNFESKVSSLVSGGLFGGSPTNGGIATMAIEENTRILMDLGVPQDKAIAKAVKAFETSYTMVNGVYVNTRDRLVPGDIEAVSSAIVEDFLKTNPDYDGGYLTPDREQDYWTVTDEFGMRLRGAPKYHVSQLSSYLSNRNREAANKAIADNK
jgi:hypothetical protein